MPPKRKANSNNNSNSDNTKKKKKPTKKTESTKKKKTKIDYPEHKCDMKKTGPCDLCCNPARVVLHYKVEGVVLSECTSCFWRAMYNHKLFEITQWLCCDCS